MEVVDVRDCKKNVRQMEIDVLPVAINRKVRAASVKLKADPTINDLRVPTSRNDGAETYNLNHPNQQEYSFDDFFDENAHIPLPSQRPTNHISTPEPPPIRLERTALSQEFHQKICQIFNPSDPEFLGDFLTEEAWSQQVIKLSKRVERHEVDLRGELDVLRTVCKKLHDGYYKIWKGGERLAYGDSKVSEAIEFVRGVFGDVLYYGAGLAVEDALQVVKLRYQERLEKMTEEHDEGGCDFARKFEEESARQREEYQNSLTALEEEVRRSTALFTRKMRAGSETDEASPTKNGDSGKRVSKKAEIKILQGQVSELRQQLNQNTHTSEQLSHQQEIVQGQTIQIRQHKERIEEQANEIASLRSELTRRESSRSGWKGVQNGGGKSPYFSSQTIAAIGASPVTNNSNTSATAKQEFPVHPPKLIHVQGKPLLVPSSSPNQPPSTPAKSPTPKRKRKKKNITAATVDLSSIMMPVGLSDTSELKGKRKNEEVHSVSAPKLKKSKKSRNKNRGRDT